MNVAVWIVSCALAALFLLAGATKIASPKEKLVDNPNLRWAEDFSPGMLKLIGVCEVAGAVGLVLPGVLGMATWLVPTAAVGLAVLMIGAALTHVRRREYANAIGNAVLFAAAAFVAIERFGPQSF